MQYWCAASGRPAFRQPRTSPQSRQGPIAEIHGAYSTVSCASCSIHDILFREKVMRSKVIWIIALLAAGAAQAQIFTLSRDQIIEYTAKNPFERFADGRPKVPRSEEHTSELQSLRH